MRRLCYTLTLLGGLALGLHAQPVGEPASARAQALGGISASLLGIDALYGNCAGLSADSLPGIMVGYRTLFSLPELSSLQAGAYLPLPPLSLGFSINRFGQGAYHQHHYNLLLARRLNQLHIGLKLGLVQLATEGFASRRVAVVSFGGISQLLPRLSIGAYAYNLNARLINPETGDKLPSLLQLGVHWRATKTFSTYAELEKELDSPTRTKLGLEYRLRPFLQLRTGFKTQPLVSSAGLGLQLARPGQRQPLSLHYSLQQHRYLGTRHHLSLALRLPAP